MECCIYMQLVQCHCIYEHQYKVCVFVLVSEHLQSVVAIRYKLTCTSAYLLYCFNSTNQLGVHLPSSQPKETQGNTNRCS